ncbi:MAG: hypothetical protein GXY20_08080 [Clostridiales bacterium]|nr:hypothetical protein [Clostridiales bacterium]
MLEDLRKWILAVAAASLFSGIATVMAPSGKLKRTVSCVCGIMTVAVIINSFTGFNFSDYASNLIQFRITESEYLQLLQEENAMLLKAIIEDKTRAYILDKALSLGVSEIVIDVQTKASGENYPYPYSIVYYGNVQESVKTELISYVESEIGIPEERQYWREDEQY